MKKVYVVTYVSKTIDEGEFLYTDVELVSNEFITACNYIWGVWVRTIY